jgi:hypothetical protein
VPQFDATCADGRTIDLVLPVIDFMADFWIDLPVCQ